MRATLDRLLASIVLSTVLMLPQAEAIAQTRSRGAPAILPIKPVEIAEGDNELRRLLKERYNAVTNELRPLYAMYRGGRTSHTSICQATEKFAEVASDLAETPVARVSELELARDVGRAVESIAVERHEAGLESLPGMEHCRVCRLGMEIQVIRAREAAKAAREPK